MKNSIFTLFLGIFLVCLSSQNLSATNPISEQASILEFIDIAKATDGHDESKSKRFFKKIKKKVQKFVGKVKATYYKVAGMFDDPVKKWMWFWLLFGLLAVVLIVLAVIVAAGGSVSALYRTLWYLGWASSLFSSVSFVIWIVKLIQG